jgi:hypothetical protein
VTIRNPRLIPNKEMAGIADGANVTLDADGVPEDMDAALGAGHRLAAKLIIGWHVWDPTVPVKLDERGNLIEDEETAPRLLPTPATPEAVAKVPMEIFGWLSEELARINPQQPPAK